MPRLLVDVSSHGYGHLAQAGPVLDALAARLPGLELTVRSGLSRERLARRIAASFRHVHAATDFGFAMRNAVDLDLPATARRYREFHADWEARVAAEAAWQRDAGFDAVLADVAYLPLAGAARAGIPAVALCSLNWADLFADHFAAEPWATSILAQMRHAYSSARAFLRVAPGMPMAWLGNAVDVGPLCRMTDGDRSATARLLGMDPAERWALLAMGGIDFPLALAAWPRRPGLRWLVPPAMAADREDVTVFDSERIDFTALLACADLVVTKPGYGTFVEAACHGRPVLYVPRDGWAEEAFLADWLRRNTRALAVGRERLAAGDLDEAMAQLLAQPEPPRPSPTGIGEAAGFLAAMMKGTGLPGGPPPC